MLCNLRDWHRLGNPARKTEMKQDEPMKYVQAVEVNISKRHQWVYIPCGSGPELHLEHGNRNISGFFHGQDIQMLEKRCDVFSVWGR